MLAIEPVATKKSGARMSQATVSSTTTWISTQRTPATSSMGSSRTASRSAWAPMAASIR